MERLPDLLNAIANSHAEFQSRTASDRFSEAANLSASGNYAESALRSAEGDRELEKTIGIRRVWGRFLEEMAQLGIDDVPLSQLNLSLPRLGQGETVKSETIQPSSSSRLNEDNSIVGREQPAPKLPGVPTEIARQNESSDPVSNGISSPESEVGVVPAVLPAPESRTNPVAQPSELTSGAGPSTIPETKKQDKQSVQAPSVLEGRPVRKRGEGDFGPREEQLAYAMLAINEERSGLKNPTIEDAIAEVYKDTLDKARDEKERSKKLYTLSYNAQNMLGRIQEKLLNSQAFPDRRPFFLGQFMEWVNSQPEYSDLSAEQLVDLLLGTTKFENLRKSDLDTEVSTDFVQTNEESSVQTSTGIEVVIPPSSSEAKSAELVNRPRYEERMPAEPKITPRLEAVPALSTENAEVRARKDLTEHEERIAYALLEINEDNSNFKYPKRSDVVEFIYQDRLDEIRDVRDKKAKASSLAGALHGAMKQIMAKLSAPHQGNENLPEHITKLFEWTKSRPEYQNLSADDLEKVIFRRVDFSQLQVSEHQLQGHETRVATDTASDPASRSSSPEISTTNAAAPGVVEVAEIENLDPKLSVAETYLLAQRLVSLDQETLDKLGIVIANEDRQEIQDTIVKLSDDPRSLEFSAETGLRLFNILRQYTKEKPKIFLANDEDAQFLLATLGSIDSEEAIELLSGVNLDAKKKARIANAVVPEASNTNSQRRPQETPTIPSIEILDDESEEVDESEITSISPHEVISPFVSISSVPVLNERQGMPPLTVETFEKWKAHQLEMRQGNPDMILRDGTQPAWELLNNFAKYVTFEDEHVLVVNKLHRLNSHYSPSFPVGVEEIAKSLRKDDDVTLVNILEKEATGALVLAKNAVSLWKLREQFQGKSEHEIKRLHLLLLDGEFNPKKKLNLEMHLERTDSDRLQIVDPKATDQKRRSLLYSESIFEPVAVFSDEDGTAKSLVEVDIRNGTLGHIRAIASEHLGAPLVGDKLYNPRYMQANRPLMHAHEMHLYHPIKNNPLVVNAPAPRDFQRILSKLNWEY